MKKLVLFFLLILAAAEICAQYYNTGQDPAAIRWKQINTRNFQIIFPDYYEEQALILAGKLEAAFPYVSYTLRHNPHKIPVVLHTQTVESNGLVAWAPKRAEFYTTPPQSIYPQDWLEQLALHEFRHVVQVDKIESNLPFWVKPLLGQQGTAMVFGAYIPWWFIEGDAVITETTLSNFGRGRHPSFLMEHQAQVVEKGVYSYDKAFFRSYRDFVPNHYSLGYYLAGNIRAKYGSDIWNEIFTKAANRPFSINPVNQVLKKRTGKNIVQNYSEIFDSLQMVWKVEDKEFQPAPAEVVSREGKFYTSYTENHWLNDSTILSFKSAYDQIPAFIKLNKENNRETKLFSPGSVFNESVGFRNEWIVWAERISDPRWQHSGYSLIRFYNVQNQRKFEFRTQLKSFSPSISPGKNKLAVVETDFSSNNYISVYQIPDGKLLHRFQASENNYFFSPDWISDNELAAVMLTKNGKRLIRIEYPEGRIEQLFDKDLGDIKDVKVQRNHIYFIGSYSGKNSLYRMNLNSLSIEMIYEPRFGAESPAISPDGSRIVLSDYTSDGFRLIETDITGTGKKPEEIGRGKFLLAEILTSHEAGFPVFPDTISGKYNSEPYRKAGNLFKFHSWAPLAVDIDAYAIRPGVSLMSQNVLGTSETVMGYSWDIDEKTGRFIADYSYKGWYPVFDLSFSYGNRASHYPVITDGNNGGTMDQDTILQRYTWGETKMELKTKVPLVFDKGPFARFIQPEIQYGYNLYSSNSSTPEQFQPGNFHSMSYRLYMSQVLRKSYLDMYPDFGIVVDGNYSHTIDGSIQAGNVKALQSVIYLPGIMKNHGIKIYTGAQLKESGETLQFGDVVRFARGWGRINTTSVVTGAADYKLPLIYPDWNLWGVLYTRRVNTSFFGDFSRLKGNYYAHGRITGEFAKDIYSLGTEVTANVNVLRFYAPSTIGFRFTWIPEVKNVYMNFLFSIDLASF